MQLDIFEHSRDVMLRNAAIDALRTRDVASITRAIAALAAEYAGDPLLPAFTQLLERLRLSIAVPLNRASATEAMQNCCKKPSVTLAICRPWARLKKKQRFIAAANFATRAI